MAVRVTVDKTGDLLKALKALTSREVLIGVPAEGADRKPEPGEDTAPNNATIGYLMEFGEPERNLPARPHLIPGVEGAMPQIIPRLRKTGEAALSGNLADIDKGLMAAGLMGQNVVRAKITDGPFVPLAPRTLAQRKAKGRTGEKPLIDTGQYRRAQTYVLRDKGR